VSETKSNQCSGGPKLIFACSGAADVGEIADRAARQMAKDGIGKMFCLAGIGGRVDGIIKTTQEASQILTIDGCGLDCAKKSLELAGFSDFKHLQLTELDMEKGKTAVTEQTIAKVVEKGSEVMKQRVTDSEADISSNLNEG